MFAPFFWYFSRLGLGSVLYFLCTLYLNLFPLLGKLTDCCLAPDYQEFSCGLFYTPTLKAEKLTSCAQPQSNLTSSEARESAHCPRVPDCGQSYRMSRILRIYLCKKVAKSRNIFYGGKSWLQSLLRLYNVTFANSDSDLTNLLFSESFMSSSFQLRLAGCHHLHFHFLVWRQRKHWTVHVLPKMAIFSAKNIFGTKYSKTNFLSVQYCHLGIGLLIISCIYPGN